MMLNFIKQIFKSMHDLPFAQKLITLGEVFPLPLAAILLLWPETS